MFNPSRLYVGLGRLPILPAPGTDSSASVGLFPGFARYDPRNLGSPAIFNPAQSQAVHLDIARQLLARGESTNTMSHSMEKFRRHLSQSARSNLDVKRDIDGKGEEWREEDRPDTPDEGLDLTCSQHSPQHDSQHSPTSNNLSFSIDRILGRNPPPHHHLPHHPPHHHPPPPLHRQQQQQDAVRDAGEEKDKTDDEDVWKGENEVEEEVEKTHKYSWLQCTRYKPPKLPRSKKKESCRKRKLGRNPRVPFTQHQVVMLEQKFRQTHYLSSVDVAELSAALNLTETRVKIWFQNRRARERRDRDVTLKPVSLTSSSESLKKTASSPPTSSCEPLEIVPSADKSLKGMPLTFPFMQPQVSSFPSAGGSTRPEFTSGTEWRPTQSAFTPVLRLS